jgi:caspase domain-containing protein
MAADELRAAPREFDPEGLAFDASTSTAILIAGASYPRHTALEALPEARASVLALADALADVSLAGFRTVIPVLDQTYPQVVEQLMEICKPLQERSVALNDCLLIYFAGHGLPSEADERQLLLASRNTHADYVDDSTLPASTIKRIMGRCKVGVSILMLDCCYSGKAVDTGFPETLKTSLENMARYVVASSSPRRRSWVLEGSAFTGFSDAFLTILKNGLTDCGATIPFSRTLKETAALCVQRNLPEPWLNFAGQASGGSDFAFIRNKAFKRDDVLRQILNEVVPHLSAQHQTDLREALKAAQHQAAPHKAYEAIDRILYEMGQAKVASPLKTGVVKRIIGIAAFREFYNTIKNVPSWELLHESTEMFLKDNGDVQCRWVRRAKATTQFRSVWTFVTGDYGFTGFNTLHCEFRTAIVRKGSRRSIRVVPLELLDTERRKELVFYLYPEVKPDTVVELTMEYRWPRLFAPLVEKGEDYWEFRAMSRSERVNDVQVAFNIAKHLGQLTLESDDVFLEDKVTHVNRKKGRHLVTYNVRQLPVGKTVKLNLRLAKKSHV